eukprot:COSAG02_NODE_514_length_20825_cov_5.990495_6_plen_122_part_00
MAPNFHTVPLRRHTSTVLARSQFPHFSPHLVSYQIEGQDIEWIWSFLYLGHHFEVDADCTEQDMKERFGKAEAVFSSMMRVWRSTVLSQALRLRIYKSVVPLVSCTPSPSLRSSSSLSLLI